MIVVTGAHGVVGHPLVQRLTAAGSAFKTVSRGLNADIQWDLHQPPTDANLAALQGANALIHCAPIWLLPQHIETLETAGVSRVVAFSSTSVISKQSSASQDEQVLVKQLADAESALTARCMKAAIGLTILRPAMIYGYGRDQNIMQIVGLIRRLRFLPLITSADGLRQPVHADDLAHAAIAVLQKPGTVGRVYNLAGAETLSYREMVSRIFQGLGKRTLILPLPLVVYRFCLRLAALLSGFSYNAEMADRMRQNLNYDYSSATDDFGFQPQGFLEQPERDLVRLEEGNA